MMETNKITALVVIDASRHVEGVIHLSTTWWKTSTTCR